MAHQCSQDFLNSMRQKADPMADQTIQKYFTSQPNAMKINQIFAIFQNNHIKTPDDLPLVLQQYFNQTAKLPDNTDLKRIANGQDLFQRYGPQIVWILFCKSLPLAYACGHGAEVLYRTGRMLEQANDNLKTLNYRIMETAQFLLNVMAPNGFEAEGSAIRTIQKVRLIHASIRYYLQKNHTWNAEQFGLPINQEDMAGTLMSFSYSIIEGLEQLNIDLSQEEKEDYLYTWLMIGQILGVESKLLPKNVAQAKMLTQAILKDQVQASEAGIALTASLVDYLEHILPGNLFDTMPSIMIRYFVGHDVADLLQVKKESGLLAEYGMAWMRRLFGFVDDLEDDSVILQKITEKVSFALLQALTYVYNDRKQVYFFIPPSLKTNWKLV